MIGLIREAIRLRRSAKRIGWLVTILWRLEDRASRPAK